MSISNLVFWRKPAGNPQSTDESNSAVDDTVKTPSGNTNSNVANLMTNKTLGLSWSAKNDISEDLFASEPPLALGGLLSDPLIVKFFEENHFSHGRYAGFHYKTVEVREHGRAEIVAVFQNLLLRMIEHRAAIVKRMSAEIVATSGISETVTASRNVAIKHLDEEMKTLRVQLEGSATKTGWILEAIRKYDGGFTKGVAASVSLNRLMGGTSCA